MSIRRLACILPLVLAACTEVVDPGASLGEPGNLRYELVSSDNPYLPAEALLRWDEPNDDRVANYVVYSRASEGDAWSRRAETTSSTFHDEGVPNLQYFVSSEDDEGNESDGSDIVTIDERNRLPAPARLTSISLDRAVQLAWDDNARTGPGAASLFRSYRVYATNYDLDAGLCNADEWLLEGSTLSEDFLVTGIGNGVPRCFAVSTVSQDGNESVWSAPRADTPRYDARNTIIDALQSRPATSAFRFFDASTGGFGTLLDGSRSDADFRVERRTDGSLWLTPVRADVRVALYSTLPVTDLTSIDVAPVRSAFAAGAIEAVPGYAYVFETSLADGLHYGAVRVTHVSADYVILDWAWQSDPGNPELRRVRGAPIGAPAF